MFKVLLCILLNVFMPRLVPDISNLKDLFIVVFLGSDEETDFHQPHHRNPPAMSFPLNFAGYRQRGPGTSPVQIVEEPDSSRTDSPRQDRRIQVHLRCDSVLIQLLHSPTELLPFVRSCT